ncbi:unnamed protein product [Caenorhabditis bovis]|uniref:Uncharacterized protein n=1 Tax=Caenorhabditis bovis TaxID=2654633 RepID=A0A8S1ESX1_9PELO|nr:unnamed protein product [Caenorhabditis bovis]
MDEFDMYREMCANRLRRLERYKKAKSFCSLEDATATNGEVPPTPKDAESTPSTFDAIREKMFSLMENDMSLLQQLLTLSDQVSEIKKERLRRAVSHNSVDYDEEEDDDEKEDRFETFSTSMSAVTNLYVDDDRPQFFSRQNSVLRIPIPPRSSNRFGPRRVIRRPSDVLPRRTVLHVNSEESDSSSDAHSPTSVTYSTSNASTVSIPPKKNRSSNSSIDSGIEPQTPSPTFEREVA